MMHSKQVRKCCIGQRGARLPAPDYHEGWGYRSWFFRGTDAHSSVVAWRPPHNKRRGVRGSCFFSHYKRWCTLERQPLTLFCSAVVLPHVLSLSLSHRQRRHLCCVQQEWRCSRTLWPVPVPDDQLLHPRVQGGRTVGGEPSAQGMTVFRIPGTQATSMFLCVVYPNSISTRDAKDCLMRFRKFKYLMWQGSAHYLHFKYGESSAADKLYLQSNWCIWDAEKNESVCAI